MVLWGFVTKVTTTVSVICCVCIEFQKPPISRVIEFQRPQSLAQLNSKVPNLLCHWIPKSQISCVMEFQDLNLLHHGIPKTWISCIMEFQRLESLASWNFKDLNLLHHGISKTWISCVMEFQRPESLAAWIPKTWISCIIEFQGRTP